MTGGRVTGADIAKAARDWIGTPYVHQASCRGAGCDCLGLIRGIWRAHCAQEPAPLPPYTMDWSEPQAEERLWQAALCYLRVKPLSACEVGDVLLFRMRAGAVAKHLGIQSATGAPEVPQGQPRFIHAYSARGVVESALTGPWQRRIVARFAFPDEVS